MKNLRVIIGLAGLLLTASLLSLAPTRRFEPQAQSELTRPLH